MARGTDQRPQADTPTVAGPTTSRRVWIRRSVAGVGIAAGTGLAVGWALRRRSAPTVQPEVVRTYPHDPDAFCQGLLYHDGKLLESTGHYGQSTLRAVELATGRILRKRRLQNHHFGEGIALWGKSLIQLTWRSQLGFVLDRDSFALTGSFRYQGEGWGLTQNGTHFIMSDGTSTLRWLSPQNFQVVAQLTVTDGGRPVDKLNELEYIDGEVWANVWQEDLIARIDPATGRVIAWVDLVPLRPKERRYDRDAVANGIAFDADGKRLFLTGKNWPVLYEVRYPLG